MPQEGKPCFWTICQAKTLITSIKIAKKCFHPNVALLCADPWTMGRLRFVRFNTTFVSQGIS